MTSTALTPADLLRAQVRRDGARPLVTFYDDATGERVELSATTFDNWVAKTAGLLTDELDAEPGDRVAVALPPHWQTLVWAAACWTVGACVVPHQAGDGPPEDTRLAVSGPDTLDLAAGTGAGATVALALRPLGGRFTTPLPDGVLDYATEVPGYPDEFVAVMPPEPDEPGLEDAGTVHTLSGLVARAHDRAAHLSLGPAPRLLVSTNNLTTAIIDALLVPLVAEGSAVLVRHEDVTGRDQRADAEHVTTIVDAPE